MCCKPVMGKLLDKLNERNGNRLVDFKTKRGLLPSGMPQYKHPVGCYNRELFEKEPHLMRIRYVNGDSVDVLDSGITLSHELLDNWSDWGAMFQKKRRSLLPSICGSKKHKVDHTS